MTETSHADSHLSGWKKAVRSPAIGYVSAYVLVMVMFMAAYLWFNADAPDSSPQASATPAVQQTATPPPPEPSPVPSTPAPALPKPAARAAAPTPAPTRAPLAAPTPARPVPPTKTSGSVARPAPVAAVVADAQLCRDLSPSGAWRCDPAGSPVDPGTLFFYTRLKATSDTTVHHRWYRGDRVVQAVELRIRASPTNGYRTYSRNTVNAQTAGNWRVELTAANGALLHEVRFVVR